ncbi:hypothetical protein CK203_093996 [Vitis vinifera]|uniref:Uncharacterized protein n=1 Tax=Vitis vinifera TaxID=29760 RepID=A0A438BRQ3_VITVI|nr:hypothetical protein CK203_093996 [Vitis vinifera]
MGLGNPLDVVVHHLLIGGMAGLGHLDGFPMVSALVCMVTHWTRPTTTDIGSLVDYGHQFMGRLNIMDSRSRTRALGSQYFYGSIYLVGMGYEGQIGSRFTFVHKGVLVIMQGCIGISGFFPSSIAKDRPIRYIKPPQRYAKASLVAYALNMAEVAKNKEEIRKVKVQLSKEFEMKELGATKKILGMEILRDRKVASAVNKYIENPSKKHWKAVQWIFRYLHGSNDVCLHFGRTRDGVVSLKATLYTTVALSTTVAE